MDNSDVCVCCGAQVPEGMMVCPDCSFGAERFTATQRNYNLISFVEDYIGVKLYWYQKCFLRLYELSLKIPRKGLHR